MPKLAEMTDSNDRKIRMKLLHREKEAGRKQAQLGKRSKQGYSGKLDIHKTPLSVPTDRHNGCQETDGHSINQSTQKAHLARQGEEMLSGMQEDYICSQPGTGRGYSLSLLFSVGHRRHRLGNFYPFLSSVRKQ